MLPSRRGTSISAVAAALSLLSLLLPGCGKDTLEEDELLSSGRATYNAYPTYPTTLFGRTLAEEVGQGLGVWLTAPDISGQASQVLEGSFGSNSSSDPQQVVTNHLFHRIPVFTEQPTSLVRLLINTYETFVPAFIVSFYNPLLERYSQAWVAPQNNLTEASSGPGLFEVTLMLLPLPYASRKFSNDELMSVFISDAKILTRPEDLDQHPRPKVDASCRYSIQLLPVSGQIISGPLLLSESGSTQGPVEVALPMEREYAWGGRISLSLPFAKSFVTRASMTTGDDDTGWPDLSWAGEEPVPGVNGPPYIWAIGKVLSSVSWSIGADNRTAIKPSEKASIKQVEVIACPVEELGRLQAMDLRDL